MRNSQPATNFHPTAYVCQWHRMEWARMAQSAYASGHNAIGHRYSVASATAPDRMNLKEYDALMKR